MTEEQKISRERVEYALSHLPPLTEVKTPPSIRKAKWYQESGIKEALTVWALPLHLTEKFSGKLAGVAGNFEAADAAGVFKTRPTLIIPSSGNFLKDAGGVARGYDVAKILGVLPRGISEGKLKQIEATGVAPMVTPEGMSTVQYAYSLQSQTPNSFVMNQYIEDATVQGNSRVMKHIGSEAHWLEFNDQGVLFGAASGTCAMLTAAHRYLPANIQGPVKIFGVASHSKKEKVPASRSPEDFEELRDINGQCGFMFREEWNRVLDFPLVTEVLRDEAYAMNGELFGYHYSVGPTGALVTAGMYRLFERLHERGELKKLLGEISNVVLAWMDSYYAYDAPEYRKFLAPQI